MINKAQELKNLSKEVTKQARDLLNDAIETGDLKQALQVFQMLKSILPTTSWCPRKESYPLFWVYLDRYDHLQRGGVYSFLGMLEEEIWYFTKATEEEIADITKEGEWHPEESAPMLWEIMKNGHSKFTFDW